MTTSGASQSHSDQSHSEKLPGVVEHILKIPSRYRLYQVDPAEAARTHKLNDEILEELLDLGVPHVMKDGQRHFDSLDLHNVAFELHYSSPRWVGMLAWARMLAETKPTTDLVHGMRIRGRCPDPGHAGACSLRLYQPHLEGHPVESWEEEGPGLCSAKVRAQASSVCFGPDFAQLGKAAADLRFHLIPWGLEEDFGFLRETGLADCKLASLWLDAYGREQGINVRAAAGLFVAKPLPVKHNWVEFQHEGEWLGADPFLLGAFHRWGITDPVEWPINRSLGGLLWRLESPDESFYRHEGSAADYSIYIRSTAPAS